eukprot:TRINITY_DN4949_c0_g2_i1.p1 TRINITY_DN4949_c0_g2~~TRINITY_DN4949_c0_g2_i1.p1  ORF type:complete len:447 (-),score=51.41 TRINITY_DN4949_c0_g2_i1:141-1481(-)
MTISPLALKEDCVSFLEAMRKHLEVVRAVAKPPRSFYLQDFDDQNAFVELCRKSIIEKVTLVIVILERPNPHDSTANAQRRNNSRLKRWIRNFIGTNFNCALVVIDLMRRETIEEVKETRDALTGLKLASAGHRVYEQLARRKFVEMTLRTGGLPWIINTSPFSDENTVIFAFHLTQVSGWQFLLTFAYSRPKSSLADYYCKSIRFDFGDPERFKAISTLFDETLEYLLGKYALAPLLFILFHSAEGKLMQMPDITTEVTHLLHDSISRRYHAGAPSREDKTTLTTEFGLNCSKPDVLTLRVIEQPATIYFRMKDVDSYHSKVVSPLPGNCVFLNMEGVNSFVIPTGSNRNEYSNLTEFAVCSQISVADPTKYLTFLQNVATLCYRLCYLNYLYPYAPTKLPAPLLWVRKRDRLLLSLWREFHSDRPLENFLAEKPLSFMKSDSLF